MKKKKSKILNNMQVFKAILKDNGELDPSIFVKENSFVVDEEIVFYRSNQGWYSLQGFELNDEGILDKEKTEIYFGAGNDKYAARWAKRELNGSSPSNQVSVFTEEAGMDGTFTPADGLLDYVSITIILHP